MKLYLDSNVFVYYALRNQQYFEKCGQILAKIRSGENKGVISVHVLGEVYRVVKKYGGAQAALAATDAILSLPFEIVESNASLFVEARKLAGKYGLDIFDAVHVASAVLSKADKIISNHAKFRSVREVPVESL